jgi:protein-disulfide isomerase
MSYQTKIGSRNFLRDVQKFIVILLALICFFGYQPITLAITEDFEADVLSIIRSHPETIWHAYEDYFTQKEQRSIKVKENALEQLNDLPHSIVTQSPKTSDISGKEILITFSDFQCPYCAQVSKSLERLIRRHDDKVTLVYKHFPLSTIHPEAQMAAKASWAADKQGRFWDYQKQLFRQQKHLSKSTYINIARKLGLDLDKFRTDLNSEDASTQIQADIELAQRFGITSTPSFVTREGVVTGALSTKEFENVLQLSNKETEDFKSRTLRILNSVGLTVSF